MLLLAGPIDDFEDLGGDDDDDDDDDGDDGDDGDAAKSVDDLKRELVALRAALDDQERKNGQLAALSEKKGDDAAEEAKKLRAEVDAVEEERLKTLKLVVQLVGADKCAALLSRGDVGVPALLSETSAAPSPKKGKLPAGLGSCATNPYVSGMYGPKADALHRFRLN